MLIKMMSNYDEWKLSTPPQSDDKTDICVMCELELPIANMVNQYGDYICNKCINKYLEKPNKNDKP